MMLLQFIFVIFTLSSCSQAINEATPLLPSSSNNKVISEEKNNGHREKRQINLFGFNPDFGQALRRTINTINLVRDTVQFSRDLGSTLSNAFNPQNGTADSTGVYPGSQLRAFRDRFQQLQQQARASLFTFFQRMGIVQ